MSSLARDYLAISAASCPVERLFSSAADVCTQDRMALKRRAIERLVGGRLWSVEGVKMEGKFVTLEDTMKDCITRDEEARVRRR